MTLLIKLLKIMPMIMITMETTMSGRALDTREAYSVNWLIPMKFKPNEKKTTIKIQ